MQATVDISIFSSPTEAFGNATGELTVQDSVHSGDVIAVLSPGAGDWFSGKLRVVSVNRPSPLSKKVLIELEDVVSPSRQDADRLALRFEKEAGLFVDRY